jgi:hypothetical protein
MALTVVVLGTHNGDKECAITLRVEQSVWIIKIRMADREENDAIVCEKGIYATESQ